MACPTDEDLACYFDGLLSKEEEIGIDNHVVGCSRCQEIVEITKKIVKQGRG